VLVVALDCLEDAGGRERVLMIEWLLACQGSCVVVVNLACVSVALPGMLSLRRGLVALHLVAVIITCMCFGYGMHSQSNRTWDNEQSPHKTKQ